MRKNSKPKPSQTLYFVGREKDGTPTMKNFFIEKVITTKKIETIVGVEISHGGIDENGLYIQRQELVKKMLNHTLIKTRCGKDIDLTIDENSFFVSRKKAKKAFQKLINTFVIADEFGMFQNGDVLSGAFQKTRGVTF